MSNLWVNLFCDVQSINMSLIWDCQFILSRILHAAIRFHPCKMVVVQGHNAPDTANSNAYCGDNLQKFPANAVHFKCDEGCSTNTERPLEVTRGLMEN